MSASEEGVDSPLGVAFIRRNSGRLGKSGHL